jgi:hypothetical protein
MATIDAMGSQDSYEPGADLPRGVDVEAVEALARVAKLPQTPAQAAANVERLNSFLEFVDGWEGLGLAFSFEDGEFGYAPSIAQFRPEWDRATGLNKGRVVDSQPDVDGV